ncbi:hypothetical protein [Halobacterium wangiae]|uniref:hypothetical protein n=1 Tax=Halobacterium wangiae TaxID=2902623 RepID=UPI001E35E932|nr:hypothetical protein [Halobacterium wangiae]
MPSNPTRRRRFLHGSALLATTALSGCSNLFGSGSDGGEPDEGTDSYGILLLNETERTHTVTVEVRELFADEPIFSETTEIEPDEETEWESVLTEQEQQYRVAAELENAVFYDQSQQNRATVSVGTPASPDIENLVVKVAPYFDERTVWVNKTSKYGE